jgi:hypothetical protein
MIDPRALKKLGSTDERLRQILTAVHPGEMDKDKAHTDKEKEEHERRCKDHASRVKLEKFFQDKLDQHVRVSLKDYRHYSVIDLAWDSDPINSQTLPLIQFAQGHINLEVCVKDLETLGMTEYIKRDEQKKAVGVNISGFFAFNVNLLRSIINRRLAAQSNKYTNLWPYYKYEARGSSNQAKLRADATSQRMDVMADQMGWRQHDIQWYRDAMLYGWSVDFSRCGWEQHKTAKVKVDRDDLPDEDVEVETVIEREGVVFFNPHPTRVFWDDAYPLSTINSDTGCQHVGFWDIRRWSEIGGNPHYFNREAVQWNSGFWIDLQNTGYDRAYHCTINAPTSAAARNDPAAPNDAKSQMGLYSATTDDSSALVAQFYRKVIPKEIGWGDYPNPVWVRFTVAGDKGTIVYAETMPSTPGAYLGINQNDGRRKSLSLAHEILPFQDQMTNLATQMLSLAKMEMLKIYDIDSSQLTPEQIAYIKAHLEGGSWGSKPLFIVSDHSKLAELGLKDSKRVNVTENTVDNSMATTLRAMAELVNMAERLLSMSPAEQGQPAPREISATEVNEISNTTQSVYSFISDAIDEGRAAKKRICFESLIALGEKSQVMPVQHRYTKKTVEDAGFKVVSEDKDELEDGSAARVTIMGNKSKLVTDLIFTSRDGAERSANSAAANVLTQLAGSIVAMPGVMQAMGKERFYNLINEIFRLSGSGFDLNLEMQEGESNDFEDPKFEQLMQIVQQLGQQTAANTDELAKIDQVISQLAQVMRPPEQPQQQLAA